jgi:hypothetical protein
LDECVYFPNGRNDDFVDALVQALMYLQKAQVLKGAAISSGESYWRRQIKNRVIYG